MASSRRSAARFSSSVRYTLRTFSEEFKAGISRQRALELLHQDAQQALSAIERLVTVSMSQPQLDALASFVFNVGVGAFAQSTLLKVLNAGHYDRCPTS